MQGFRNKRIALLIIALFLSGLFITSPWKDVDTQPEGAPFRDTMRGPNWGIDITGGSRIMLELQAYEAEIKFPSPPSKQEISSIIGSIENRLKINIEALGGDENVEETGLLRLLIKKSVSESRFKTVLSENIQLISFKKASFGSGRPRQIRSQLMDDLKQRVDPQGTLGAQFRPIGQKFLMYEVSLPKDEAMRLLGQTGDLEIFVDSNLVLWDNNIGEVGSLQRSREGKGLMIPFDLIGNGPERWAKYTEDKTDHSGVIYMDRPRESVILLPDDVESDLERTSLSYQSEAHKFRYSGEDIIIPYNIQVPVVRINTDTGPVAPEETKEYLRKNSEYFLNAIWLGERNEIPEEILKSDNFFIENTIELSITTIPRRLDEDENRLKWIRNRICGVESDPPISAEVAGKELKGLSIRGITREEGEELRTILSQEVSLGLKSISAESVDRRLSSGFLQEASIAALAAFAMVGILVYSFYRRLKIVIPLLLTMLCEVIITFGAASAVPDAFMSIGLPGLGGLIAVVGTGVDHQIIIADEVLEEKTSEQGKLPFERRTGKAFGVIFAAAATTIVAMIALAIFGFGPMRGFAIVTLFGVLVSVFVTRPAFARIVGILLEREEESQS